MSRPCTFIHVPVEASMIAPITLDLLFTLVMCAMLLLGGGLALYSLLTLDVAALLRGGRALTRVRRSSRPAPLLRDAPLEEAR